jgi:hypothetical protein
MVKSRSPATPRTVLVALAAAAGLALPVTPAGADHTDPRSPLASVEDAGAEGMRTEGAGTWRFIRNFAGPVGGDPNPEPNPGSDLEFFRAGRRTHIASGTLGQATVGHVGQRVIRLVNRKGRVRPVWIADHGSAHCGTANPSGTTGLQHDSQVTGYREPELLVDTTDATGRCHDPGSGSAGGGLELIDISKIERPAFKPREIHLIRLAGFSHTATVDVNRPWIVYNSSSDFAGRNWIDVADISSCLGLEGKPRRVRRNRCRPEVYRIPFQPDWSRLRSWDTGELRPGTEAACHDITSKRNRLYCAGLNATLIFNVANLTTASGAVRGTPIPCTLGDGTDTGAKVTDCSAVEAGDEDNPVPRARGWRFVGTFNHPGRDCTGPPAYATTCNSNLFVSPTEGVSVSHEADPTHDNRWMFVTDERGGGVVPPGASCTEGVDNPQGNGGMHAFRLTALPEISYGRFPNGDKAVWRSDILNPAATFCDIHVIEHIPGEQRLIVAYYSSGAKIVDYWIENGRWYFRETASLILPGANTWAVEDFKIRRNRNGTRTYFFAASDIQRGIDVFSWKGRPNPIGAKVPAAVKAEFTATAAGGNAGLLGLGLLVLPAAAWIGRRRRRAV